MVLDRLRVVILAMRLSDHEREQAAESLKGDYAAGRLSAEELEGRLGRLFRPGACRDLGGNLRELSRAGLRRPLGLRVRRLQRWVLRMHLLASLSVNACALAIWAILGEGFFWPAIFLIPSIFLLVWHLLASRALTRTLARNGW